MTGLAGQFWLLESASLVFQTKLDCTRRLTAFLYLGNVSPGLSRPLTMMMQGRSWRSSKNRGFHFSAGLLLAFVCPEIVKHRCKTKQNHVTCHPPWMTNPMFCCQLKCYKKWDDNIIIQGHENLLVTLLTLWKLCVLLTWQVCLLAK